jgi:hypothetical protein
VQGVSVLPHTPSDYGIGIAAKGWAFRSKASSEPTSPRVDPLTEIRQ